MASRSTPGNSYSASSDLSQVEYELAKVLFSVGLDWANIASLSIDDILDKINECNTINPRNVVNSGEAYASTLASEDYLKTQNTLLTIMARRLWYWRQLATGVL